MDGPIRHVDSVQHQSLFVANGAHMPPQILSYQCFQPPSVPRAHAQPAIGAAGMMWKPPVVPNGNLATNYYHRPNEQLNRLVDVNTNISRFSGVPNLLNVLFLEETRKKITKR